jgi:hypothetical protein
MEVKTKDNLTKNKLKEIIKYVDENEISETKIDSNIKTITKQIGIKQENGNWIFILSKNLSTLTDWLEIYLLTDKIKLINE